MKKQVLCMDIGGTNIRTGIVDEDFGVRGFTVADSSIIFTGDGSIDNLKAFIKQYVQHNFIDSPPAAISLGLPATIDREGQYIISAPNVKGINNIHIVNIFEEKFNVPVFINKDVNMILRYDMHALDLKSDGVIIACYIGTGFGNAIWINGGIHLGYSGSAGELGHIPVLGRHDICSCGNGGCIENYTGGKQLENIKCVNFPDTDIVDIFSAHKDEQVIEEFIEALSVPIATEINILDPDYVILGGGVIQMKDFPVEKLEKHIRAHTRKPYPEKTLRIMYSSRNPDNGVIGAGIFAFEKLRRRECGL